MTGGTCSILSNMLKGNGGGGGESEELLRSDLNRCSASESSGSYNKLKFNSGLLSNKDYE